MEIKELLSHLRRPMTDKQIWAAKIFIGFILTMMIFNQLISKEQITCHLSEYTRSLSRVRKVDTALRAGGCKTLQLVDHCAPYQHLMTAKEQGRIGNLMSLYATMLALAAMTGFTPRITKETYDELAGPFPGISMRYDTSAVKDCEPGLLLNPSNLTEMDTFFEVERDKERHVKLIAYPNAVRLFHQARPIINREFTFSNKLKETAQAFLHKCKKMSFELDVWFIGIHVRRTDYIHHLDVTQDGKPVTKRYFQRAISRMEENLQKDFENVPKLLYIVTSDDPGWCKGQFDFNDKLLFHSADAKNELNLNLRDLDMAIAANCNHTIYDYGTFGFWGAYLSGGYTILAQNMGPGINWGIENVKAANIDNWERLDAFAS